MKKTFYALFLCLCLPIALCGCSAQNNKMQIGERNAFRIVRQADASGKIALSYIFPVNTQFFEEKGCQASDIRTYRFYLSLYVGALAQQYRQRQTIGTSVGNTAYFTDVDGLGFTIIFDDLDAQNRYFGVTDSNQQESPRKLSGFFVKKMEIETTFPFSKQSAQNLKQICRMAISSFCSAVQANEADFLPVLEDSLFIYDFASTQKTLKSKVFYDDQNFRHNVFIKTGEELDSEPKISFYVSYPNTPVWYIGAIVISLGAMAVLYFVLNKKSKQKILVK